jgi:hypothetical protein
MTFTCKKEITQPQTELTSNGATRNFFTRVALLHPKRFQRGGHLESKRKEISFTGEQICSWNPPMHQPPSNFSTMNIFTNTPSLHSTKNPNQRKTKKNPNLVATFDLGVCDATGIACTYSIARPRSSSSSAHTLSPSLSPDTHAHDIRTQKTLSSRCLEPYHFLVSPPETKIISWGFRQHRNDVASSGARKTKATLTPSDHFFFFFFFFFSGGEISHFFGTAKYDFGTNKGFL